MGYTSPSYVTLNVSQGWGAGGSGPAMSSGSCLQDQTIKINTMVKHEMNNRLLKIFDISSFLYPKYNIF
jgi:hypothetical protein